MDRPTTSLVEYAESMSNVVLSSEDTRATIRPVVDSVGCALGAFHSPPASIARRLAGLAVCTEGASALGVPAKTTPEYAAFANTVMVRYLDYNDMGPAGHPSDAIPAAFAVAEYAQASGAEILRAIFIMYEVGTAMSRNGASPSQLRSHGVDYAFTSVAAAIGAGVLLRLTPTQLGHAISLAIVPHVPLQVTRTGLMSHWKCGASAASTMNGVWASRLAKEGLTGPEEPFEGVAGFKHLVGVAPDAMDDIGLPQGGWTAVETSPLKFYPAEYNAHGPLELFFDMIQDIDVDQIAHINVSTHYIAWHEIGGGQGDSTDKWDPKTRETADHSLPYLLAVALRDGEITVESFSPSRIADPSLRPLMNKIAVTADPELTRQFDEGGGVESPLPSIIEIEMLDGTTLKRQSTYAKGSPHNPASDAELDRKFLQLSEKVLDNHDAIGLLSTLRSFDKLDDIATLMSDLRGIGS